MSLESLNKNHNGSNVSRFALDGVVAEMVIEVEEHDPFLSPTKTLKLNGLAALEKLIVSGRRNSLVDMDSTVNMEGSSGAAESQQKNDKTSTNNETEKSEEVLHEDNSVEIPANQTYKEDKDSYLNQDESVQHKNKENESVDIEKTELSTIVENDDKMTKIETKDLKQETVSKSVDTRKKISHLEKTTNDVKADSEQEIRQLRSKTVDKKEDISKNTRNKKMKTEVAKSDVPRKTVKQEDSKRSYNKRNLPAEEEVEMARKRLRSAAQEDSKATSVQKPSTAGNSSTKKPVVKPKPEIKREPPKRKPGRKAANMPPKPKAYHLNREGRSSLGSYPGIKENVNESDMKYLRYLYRILYDQWPPKSVEELKNEILKFEGFSFKRKSPDFEKREIMLKKMPDFSVAQLCKILDLKVETKDKMISNISTFLIKPVKFIVSIVDPFQPSMQPVVKLQRISLDMPLSKAEKNDTPKPLKVSKRKRIPSVKLEIYVSDMDLKKKSPAPEQEPVSSSKSEKKKPAPEKQSTLKERKGEPIKTATVQKASEETVSKASPKVNKVLSALTSVKKKGKARYFKSARRKTSQSLKARQKLIKLALKIQKEKSPVKTEVNEEKEEVLMPESEIKVETESDDLKETNEQSDNSSDVTLSSDEMKQQTKQADLPKKRISHKRVGKPLRYFTKIKENILNSSFSALQRLHILLFGASDKADNLKGNILAFGGFPFLEGSEEWKQKEFLLSLLAQNTLREYLHLLCIDHGDDDQHALINKLMKFLAAPSEKLPDDDIKTEVISSELVSHAPVQEFQGPVRKKKVKKVEEKKKSRPRKVLMDEAQVKRLEADLAREQRILERERRLKEDQLTKELHIQASAAASKTIKAFQIKEKNEASDNLEKKAALTAKQTDAELLSALLETVYKRRALKKAGVVISAPNKGIRTRLGELANVKFLVVTGNYSDLDVLHHLLYMTEANKSRVRKNILDFAGFNFTEDSAAYKDRMDFLNSLGYDISKRIAFLLGLCPFKTDIAQQDLNELIMYFLMSPCQSKQIPIRHLPQTFFSKDMPKEICLLMQKHSGELSISPVESTSSETENPAENQLEITVVKDKEDTSAPRQKAKKSFKSSCLPPAQKKGLSPSVSTLPLKSPKAVVKSPLKPSQPVLLPGASNKIFLPALVQSPQPTLQKAVLKAPALSGTSNAPQEFYIQQQTPDGKQKTYKLIKLPPSHPLNSVLKKPSQPSVPSQVQMQPISLNQTMSINQPMTINQPVSITQPMAVNQPLSVTQPITVSQPIVGGPLPPGLILFKSSMTAQGGQSLPNLVSTVPIAINQPTVKVVAPPSVASTSASQEEFVLPDQDKFVLPDQEKTVAPVECQYGEDEVEELNPLEDTCPPTDEDLFNSIQEVIHSANFEDITLKNVIDRVSAQYSAFDLTHRHMFMKECVKKIIMGT